MLNTHCFVGYFTNFMSIPYNTLHTLQHFGKHFNDRLDTSTTADTITARYAELVENPIMYSKPDYNIYS
jgi:hypothetical protein